MKKRFGLLEENSSSNQDISDIQDRSNKEDISNKQFRSRKQDSSNKQVKSRKQDTSINLKNIDPDCLLEKFSELLIINMILIKKLKRLVNMLRRF